MMEIKEALQHLKEGAESLRLPLKTFFGICHICYYYREGLLDKNKAMAKTTALTNVREGYLFLDNGSGFVLLNEEGQEVFRADYVADEETWDFWASLDVDLTRLNLTMLAILGKTPDYSLLEISLDMDVDQSAMVKRSVN